MCLLYNTERSHDIGFGFSMDMNEPRSPDWLRENLGGVVTDHFEVRVNVI